MSDLISRQAAIDAVYKCSDIFAGDMPVMVVKADAYEALAQLPSADVAPVRHGRWIEENDVNWVGGGCWRCKCCGYGFSFGAFHEMNEYGYCPYCGAKMDEEVDA